MERMQANKHILLLSQGAVKMSQAMSSDTPQATQMTICAGPDAIPQEVGHWYSAHHVAKLETELAEARQQLVERDALIERMRESLIECLDDSHQVLAEYEQLYSATYRPQRLEAQKAIVSEAQAVLALTPPQALAAHDAEVRRKALEEVVELWESPYKGDTFSAQLYRMAAEKREGG